MGQANKNGNYQERVAKAKERKLVMEMEKQSLSEDKAVKDKETEEFNYRTVERYLEEKATPRGGVWGSTQCAS